MLDAILVDAGFLCRGCRRPDALSCRKKNRGYRMTLHRAKYFRAANLFILFPPKHCHGFSRKCRHSSRWYETETLKNGTKIENKEMSTLFYSVSGRKMKNENESSNFVFRSRRKTEIENWSSNSVFRSRTKTKNEHWNWIFVFLCRRKTVGTRVHGFFKPCF